jgi:hypothetical protein
MYPKIASQITGEFASTVKVETAENVFEIIEVDTSEGSKMFRSVAPSSMSVEDFDNSGLADTFPNIYVNSIFENLGVNFSALSTNLS